MHLFQVGLCIPFWHENNNKNSFYDGYDGQYNVTNFTKTSVTHMNKLGNLALTITQVVCLSAIWFAADYLVKRFHLPIPANLTGLLLLLILVFSRVVNVEWLRRGATWLLAEMLLFFVPAVVAVVNYQSMMEQEGLQIIAVLVISTALVIGTTAWVVDRVYRFELAMSRRRSNRHVHHLVKVGR